MKTDSGCGKKSIFGQSQESLVAIVCMQTARWPLQIRCSTSFRIFFCQQNLPQAHCSRSQLQSKKSVSTALSSTDCLLAADNRCCKPPFHFFAVRVIAHDRKCRKGFIGEKCISCLKSKWLILGSKNKTVCQLLLGRQLCEY